MFERGNYYNPRKSLTLLISSVAVGAALVVFPSIALAGTIDDVGSAVQGAYQAENDEAVNSSTSGEVSDKDAPLTAGGPSVLGPTDFADAPGNVKADGEGSAPITDGFSEGPVGSEGPEKPSESERPAEDAGTSSGQEANKPSGSAQDVATGAANQKPKADVPVIEDGSYVVGSSKDTGKVLDAAGGSTVSGTNVQLHQSNMGAGQKWQLLYDAATGFYTIGIANTNNVLSVQNKDVPDGSNVWLYEKSAEMDDGQLWKIEHVNGAYRFRSKLNEDLVVDLNSDNVQNGTNVRLSRLNGSATQLFCLLKVNPEVLPGVVIKDGGYLVVAGGKNSDFTVSIAGGSTENGANAQLASKKETQSSQRLYFNYDGNGYYTILVGVSGKTLGAAGGNLVPGTNVEQQTKSKSDAQKWALRYNEADGSYSLVNKANGLYLDINGGTLTAGANVLLSCGDGSRTQRFWLQMLTDFMSGGVYTPEDGVYVIQYGKSLGQVIDAKGGWDANGTNVQLYSSNMGNGQKWSIKRIAGADYYTIGLRGTNKVLDIAWGVASDCANVQLYEGNGTDGQLWKFVKRNGSLMIVSKLRSDLVLDLAGGQVSNGTNAQVYYANGETYQLFNLLTINPNIKPGDTIEDGSFVLVAGSQGSNVAVDISGGSRADGANAQVSSYTKARSQRFYLKANKDGFYTITSISSGKVLDVLDGNLVPYTNVQQLSANGSFSQQWALHRNVDGSYSFISRCNGLALDIKGGDLTNGTNLQMNVVNGEASQKFWFISVPMIDEGIYTINPFGGNKVLDVANGSNRDGATTRIWDSNGALGQRFQLVYDASAGAYRIRTAASGGWLTQQTDGTVRQQGSSQTPADSQNQWKAVWNGSYFSLMNLGSGLVMGISGSTAANGSILKVATANNSAGQHFFFDLARLLSDGFYEFHNNGYSGSNLDVRDSSKENGANIQIYKDTNSTAQKFKVISIGNYYVIKSLCSGKVLDVSGGSKTNGANVYQWDQNNSKSQLWEPHIADGGGIYLFNVNSGLVLTAEGNANVDQRVFDASRASQSWTLEVTKAVGWFNEKNTWSYYYEDGSSKQFTDAAKRCWDRIVNTHSDTKYLIMVDTANYRTVVFKGRAGSWAPLYDWLCGVGMPGHETQKGEYTIGGDGACYNWTRWYDGRNNFKGGYRTTYYPEDDLKYFTGYCLDIGFHSCIGWEGGYSDWSQLGKGISHGCVRLIEANAKWIYDNAMPGTKVRIV